MDTPNHGNGTANIEKASKPSRKILESRIDRNYILLFNLQLNLLYPSENLFLIPLVFSPQESYGCNLCNFEKS